MANNAMTHTTLGGLDYTVRDNIVTQFDDYSMGDRVWVPRFGIRRGRISAIPMEHFDAQCERKLVPVLFDDNPTSEPEWVYPHLLRKI